MNRKGFSPLSITGMAGLFVITLVVVILAASQRGMEFSTINKSIETLNWSNFKGNISNSIQAVAQDEPYYVQTILTICDKAIDFMGYTIFAVAHLAMEFARDNPDFIDYRLLLALVLLALIGSFIWPLFLILVSIILIIREAILDRKERIKLRKLKEKHEEE